MATPKDLLQAVRRPRTAGRPDAVSPGRGMPARGGIAARPVPGANPNGEPGVGVSLPSFKPALPKPGPAVPVQLDAPARGPAGTPAGGLPLPTGAPTPPPTVVPPKPAWQPLAEQGIGGQGSAAANRTALAGLGPGKAGSDAAIGMEAGKSGDGGPAGPAEGPKLGGPQIAHSPAGVTGGFPGFKPAAGGPGGMRFARPSELVQGGIVAPTPPPGAAPPADSPFAAFGRIGAGLDGVYGGGLRRRPFDTGGLDPMAPSPLL